MFYITTPFPINGIRLWRMEKVKYSYTAHSQISAQRHEKNVFLYCKALSDLRNTAQTHEKKRNVLILQDSSHTSNTAQLKKKTYLMFSYRKALSHLQISAQMHEKKQFNILILQGFFPLMEFGPEAEKNK